MVPSGSALTFDDLMCGQRRTPTLCPRIQEVLESMAGAAHFSTMDFKSGFWQVRMTPESQQYTAFTVGNLGFYKFTRMPFGLCNAPATFQRLMQNMLGELNLDLLHHLLGRCHSVWSVQRKNTWKGLG